jgi:hypothetical protein
VSLAVVLVAFVLSFFLKATPLRQRSAIEEAASDKRDADERAAEELDAEERDLVTSLNAQHAADLAGALVEAGTGSIELPDEDAVRAAKPRGKAR